MKMYVADSLVEKLEAEVNRLYMRGHVAAEHHVQEHALRIVYDEPTVDAEPVRHGAWVKENIRKKSYLRLCTACGKVCYFCGTDCSYKYCPNCGAKMDAEERV